MVDKNERGTFGLKLANGREIETTRPEELEHFFNTDGRSIVEEKQAKKGGKSKGARGRGRKKVRQPREERG